jgi:hypothetical protein
LPEFLGKYALFVGLAPFGCTDLKRSRRIHFAMPKNKLVSVLIAVLVVLIALGSLLAWLYKEDNSTVVSALSKVGISKTSATIAPLPIDLPSTTILDATASTTSTSIATTTTTTTVAPTTGTASDASCIRLAQCQFAILNEVDFSRLQLESIDFSAASLIYSNFSSANLSSSQFIRADLRRVNFSGADLSGVDFTAAVMTDTNLEGANLTGAIFCDVDLTTVAGTNEAQMSKIKKFKSKVNTYCP